MGCFQASSCHHCIDSCGCRSCCYFCCPLCVDFDGHDALISKESDTQANLSKESLQAKRSGLYNAVAGKTEFDGNVTRDDFNNAAGAEFDLSPDGAFKGQKMLVLLLISHSEPVDFSCAKSALERKGFEVVTEPSSPSLEKFREYLTEICQLWIVSSSSVRFSDGHLDAIAEFAEKKKGIFVWADNDPFVEDANAILKRLPFLNTSVTINGNYAGGNVLNRHSDPANITTASQSGFKPHLITTGLESLYEGVTISDIRDPSGICEAVIISSDKKGVLTALYDKDGYRLVVDGGFTRFFPQFWTKTAGTARFVTNVACYLFNFEGCKINRESLQGPDKVGFSKLSSFW